MRDDVDRLVDLTVRSTRTPAVVEALARGDLAALAAHDGEFAAVARRGRTVVLARTIGVPLRYFVAKMFHGPILLVAERIDRLFEWCRAKGIGWQFEPDYTRMVPAHYVVEIDQVGCPDPAPRYRRFFNPEIGQGSSDLHDAGRVYIDAAYRATRDWIARVPPGRRIAVAFSGGVDSTAVLLLARKAMAEIGRNPDEVRAFTLDLGGGSDAAQAEATVRSLGLERVWERVERPHERLDLEDAVRVIEDYHPLDVECAAVNLCLLRGIRERHPDIGHLLDGDGGDENLKSYPLEDSDLTLSSVLNNPLLYHEGWGVDAIKHSLVYSGGLSRGYVRTWAPAEAYGFAGFSPFATRRVIAAALSLPFAAVVGDSVERLLSLKQDVVRLGIRAVTGLDMPANPKRRFQDGASGRPRPRATKAACRRIFDRLWAERLAAVDEQERRSGNEVMV